MKKPSDLARVICKAAQWDAEKVPEGRYIELLEETIRQAEDTLDKAAAKLDDVGVKDIRKRLAFPEGTVATLPAEGDLVVHVRGLSDAEQNRLVKSLGNKVVGTSDGGLPRVGKDGQIDPASVQTTDNLEAIDKLIELTARAVEQRQANPEDVQGKTNLGWRLT